MMGMEELSYNIELALTILNQINLDTYETISNDGLDNLAQFLAEKVIEFRGNEDYDGVYGSTFNDVSMYVEDNEQGWVREIEKECE